MEWQPIETAPRDETILVTGGTWHSDDGLGGERRLTFVALADWRERVFYGGGGWHIGNGYAHDVEHWAEPTHWMPLPPPPAGTRGE